MLVLSKTAPEKAPKLLKHILPVALPVNIYQNRPLARALYDSCEVDREIPPEFYGAVAEILVYIYRESHREDMLQ